MATAVKISALAVLFIVSFLAGILPCMALKWISKRSQGSNSFRRIISLLNCFSGGVFFGVSFLHVLPEAREKMEGAITELGWHIEYPFTTLLAGVGFIGVLLIETAALTLCSPKLQQRKVKPNTSNGNHYNITISSECAQSPENETACDNRLVVSDGNGNTVLDSCVCLSTMSNSKGASAIESDGDEKDNSDSVSFSMENDSDLEIGHSTRSKLRTIILLGALSIHMVFEGLTVGLESSEAAVWAQMIPLCIHKALVFFNVGLTICETFRSVPKSLIIVGCFSLVSPAGMAIGIGMTKGEGLTEIVLSAVLQSIGAGTFIYVTFFEILQPELCDKTKGNLARAAAMALGFGSMAVLKGFVHDC